MKAAVLTVSDRVSRGEAEDRSGDLLADALAADGVEVERRVVPDEAREIAAAIEDLAAGAQVVLTTGGTGLAPRDVTPEATRTVLQREAPGIAEALRADSIAKTPHGLLSRGVAAVVAFCVVSLLVVLVAVWQLDPVVRWLWPIPVAAFVVYPYLKRVTWLCHFWLGAVDGLASVGAWAAITGRFPWQSWVLGAAVAAWVAGFDCFYALFDRDVDVQQGLHSVATRFGERCAFAAARALHVLTVLLLGIVGLGLPVGWAYWLGVLCVALLLGYEHSLVRLGDLRRLDAAFFTMNGVISVAFFAFVLADVL